MEDPRPGEARLNSSRKEARRELIGCVELTRINAEAHAGNIEKCLLKTDWMKARYRETKFPKNEKTNI